MLGVGGRLGFGGGRITVGFCGFGNSGVLALVVKRPGGLIVVVLVTVLVILMPPK
jgi:hypothetical protein